MASEQRLHPASMLFAMGRSLKAFALPGLLLFFTAGRTSGGPGGRFGGAPPNWERWMMLMLIPSALVALARYLSFRIRYEDTELVIRSGLVFRNERHIPYARIQNLDGVENVLHRLLGVVEVRVETGGGTEPEARISVLPVAAFHEMRRRVFEGRGLQPSVAEDATAAALPARSSGTPLLQLSIRELLLYGLLESRGLVVIGAAYGLLWELGLLDRFWSRLFDDESIGQGLVRSLVRSTFAGAAIPWRQIGVALAGVAALLLVARLVSMVWAAIKLYGFHLVREGNDLRVEFGLFTRVTATVPVGRIQTLTLYESPLQRLAGRTSVRAETAGGRETGTRTGSRERQWLAPIIPTADCGAFVRQILPELDLAALDWQSAPARAFRRAVKPGLVMACVPTLLLARPLGWWALAALPVMVGWAIVSARQYVSHLRWASNDEVVVFGSGWLWRRTTAARVAKVQVVARSESPFDRRNGMASLHVDTAGAGDASHKVAIPYLPRETAEALHRQLAERAASTAFRW
jgi:putative membrane protein